MTGLCQICCYANSPGVGFNANAALYGKQSKGIQTSQKYKLIERLIQFAVFQVNFVINKIALLMITCFVLKLNICHYRL